MSEHVGGWVSREPHAALGRASRRGLRPAIKPWRWLRWQRARAAHLQQLVDLRKDGHVHVHLTRNGGGGGGGGVSGSTQGSARARAPSVAPAGSKADGGERHLLRARNRGGRVLRRTLAAAGRRVTAMYFGVGLATKASAPSAAPSTIANLIMV